MDGKQAPLHQLGVLGNAVSSPSGIRFGAPTAQSFSGIYSTQIGLSWHYWGVKTPFSHCERPRVLTDNFRSIQTHHQHCPIPDAPILHACTAAMFTQRATWWHLCCSRRDQVLLTQLCSGHCRRLAAHRNIIDSSMNPIRHNVVRPWHCGALAGTAAAQHNAISVQLTRRSRSQDTTKCWLDVRDSSMTWLIRIFSLFPQVCIQQTATLTLAVTLQWSLIRR